MEQFQSYNKEIKFWNFIILWLWNVKELIVNLSSTNSSFVTESIQLNVENPLRFDKQQEQKQETVAFIKQMKMHCIIFRSPCIFWETKNCTSIT